MASNPVPLALAAIPLVSAPMVGQDAPPAAAETPAADAQAAKIVNTADAFLATLTDEQKERALPLHGLGAAGPLVELPRRGRRAVGRAPG
jgi:hypothetical protein